MVRLNSSVTELLQTLSQLNVRDHRYKEAEEALVEAGPRVAPFLEELLESSDPVVVSRADEVLKKIQCRRSSPLKRF